MKIGFNELKALLNRQGLDLVPIAPELVADARWRPVLPHQLAAGFSASLVGLAALHRRRSAAPPLPIVPVAEAFAEAENDADTVELGELFDRHGSDKATLHHYHLAYGALLKGMRRAPLAILEIGLGTNNIDVPSNMGPEGRPGASLRAFRDWAPQARIVGADVDARVLFEEERIVCHPVDQTDRRTLDALAATLAGATFDLIVDDGLHTPEANINTLLFALPLLKDDGVFVVEDISEDFFAYWDVVFLTLGDEFDCRFVRGRGGCLAIIRKRSGADR